MLQDRLRHALAEGTSVIVGTVGSNGSPGVCHGLALAGTDDLSRITVYLPVATSHDVVMHVASTRRIAISASHPIGHVTVQVKGTTGDVRIASESERPFIDARMEAYASVLDQLGVPKRITRSVVRWPAFAVDVNVEEVFDQTPGPRAGEPLT